MQRSATINRQLGTLQGVQFVSEYLLGVRGPPTERQLYGLLAFFEIAKIKLRIEKWNTQKQRYIYISDGNAIEAAELEEEEQAITFAEKWRQNETAAEGDMKTQLQQALGDLKKEKPKFNLGFQEVLDRSQLKMGVITTLPIPDTIKRKQVSKHMRVFVGELLFLLRPLVHCVLLYVYGSKSYIGYVTSLVIDVLRLFLQRDVVYYRKCEKKEMSQRLHDLLVSLETNKSQTAYALRSPFYQQVLKLRVLEPLLALLFKKNSFIARMIIQFIEIRTSASLLL